jgi:CRISPR-associated endonuclease/helicase Cas3
MTKLDVLELWGKTTFTDAYHPAIFHMIDVAQVARALLVHPGARRLQAALVAAWDGADSAALLRWAPFIIALHDIGKLATPFQGQQSTPSAKQQRARLIHAGFALGTDGDAPPTHSAISAWWLNERLRELEPGMSRDALLAIRDAAGGHHGTFATNLQAGVGTYMAAHEPTAWDELRRAGYALLRQALGPDTHTLAEIGAPRRLRPATTALTGLTVIADWVASNAQYFPADMRADIQAYAEVSEARALDALIEIGFAEERPTASYRGFQATFGWAPRDLQVQIDALTDADLAAPGLYVIEAPTGEGKTEAALALARRLAAHGASNELYVGLPTMATSNQMFARLERFFTQIYGDAGAVKLAHGQAALVEDELRRLVQLADVHGDADPDPSARRGEWAASDEQVLRWFGSSKRALLAPFGVGTVDQIELAGLNVRHAILRLFSLAGKVVVIDEVHAYDTYMSAILDHTLCWLASMGTSVILLSATLPQARHQTLARSYLAGLTNRKPTQINVTPANQYPALTLYTAAQHRTIPLQTERVQRLHVQFVNDATIEAQAQRLLDVTDGGGAVARICNRVDDAQKIYEILQKRNLLNLTLIHARYPLDERIAREGRVAHLVGKTTTRSPNDRLIIIGTQVLEQSLDYDVDVMVTDLCPIDLLLQRAGRLHRHTRSRPATHAHPTLYVQHALRADGLPEIERWKRIYAPLILWRTWLTLTARTTHNAALITLPADYRPLIETVYTEGSPASTGDAAWDAELNAAYAAYNKQQKADQGTARTRLMPDPRLPDALAGVNDIEFTEDEEGHLAGWQVAKTRLGERITVVPLYRVAGGLAVTPGGAPLGPIANDDIGAQRDLLRRALPISDRRVVAYLRDHGTWKALTITKTPPLLTYTPPLELDAAGRVAVAGVVMRLDSDLGLVIEKEEA